MTPFKKQIPNDFVPTGAGLIAACSYKSIEKLFPDKDIYFIRYYNCGVHYLSWDEGRSKYNELKGLKR